MNSQLTSDKNRETLHKICRIIIGVALINFLAFIIIAIIIGGDAVNGKEVAGRYYLANHGKLTEVNNFVFIYSKIHVFSIFITHLLAMMASIVYLVIGGKKTF